MRVLALCGSVICLALAGCGGGEDLSAYCKDNPFAEPCGGVVDTDGNGMDDSVDREFGRLP